MPEFVKRTVTFEWDPKRHVWWDPSTGEMVTLSRDYAGPPPSGEPTAHGTHEYISTTCYHAQKDGSVPHSRCRQFCKWCDAPCECECHA